MGVGARTCGGGVGVCGAPVACMHTLVLVHVRQCEVANVRWLENWVNAFDLL